MRTQIVLRTAGGCFAALIRSIRRQMLFKLSLILFIYFAIFVIVSLWFLHDAPKSDSLFNYVYIMPHKMHNTRHLCCWTSLTFVINYPQFICAHLFEKNYNSFGTPAVFLHTQVVNQTVKQRSSSANLTIVRKLHFICIKQNLFTTADEERLMKVIRE